VGLIVITPGLCTTVQDAGRPGYREWGVPVGGAFDRGSYDLANALLDNPPGTAALELTLVGGTYEAETALALALTGAPMEARVLSEGHSRPLQIPQTVALVAGERLVFGGTAAGARTYLAVKGGWQTRLILGSRSSEVRAGAGDSFPADPSTTAVRRLHDLTLPLPVDGPIRVVAGPDSMPEAGLRAWESHTFRVDSNSDRMGLRLEVGGYPHVAHVISADLDRLGQARPGDPIRFRRIDLHEARAIDRATRNERAARLVRTAALAAETGGN
jgi:allophanate hydrolase subunit 2